MSRIEEKPIPQSWQDRAIELYPELCPEPNDKDQRFLNSVTFSQRAAYLRGLGESKVLIEALEKISKGDIDDGKLSRDIMFEWNEVATQALATFPC